MKLALTLNRVDYLFLSPHRTVARYENHTTGGWDTPPGSMGIYVDLGQYLKWYGGRATDTFYDGEQVTLLFEYRTYA